MSPLPSQFERLQTRVELAVGADLSADPRNWVFTDPSDRPDAVHLDQAVTITTGRPDEDTQASPASTSFVVDNPDGAFTPDHPASPYYPDVNQEAGIPARFLLQAGSPHLAVDGSSGARARSADHADFDITGDTFAKLELTVPFWPLPFNVRVKLAGKFDGTTQRSWVFYMLDDRIALLWSTNGQASGELAAASTVPVSMPASHRVVIGFWLDVNDGGTQRTTRFYHARRWSEPLTLLDTITESGTTSIFSSTAPLDVGDVGTSGFDRPVVEVHRFELRSGDQTGTVVANPNFAAQTVGATSFNDTAPTPKSWSINGAAELSNWQTRLTGQVDELKPAWPYGDLSTGESLGEARVHVAVAGVLRRLAQGEKPLQSALYRLVNSDSNIDNVLAHWPMEDETTAVVAASPIPRTPSMVIGGDLKTGTDNALVGSKAVAQVGGGQSFGWNGTIPVPTTTLTNWAVEWAVRVPQKETNPASTVLGNIEATGFIVRWRFALSSTNVTVRGFDNDGVEWVTVSTSSADFSTAFTWMRFEIDQDGVDIDWNLYFWQNGSDVIFGTNGSIPNQPIGRPKRLTNLGTAPPQGLSVGHMIVTTDLDLGWLAGPDDGWIGETAGNRIRRLCREEDIPISIFGDPDDTEAMGEQKPDTLLNLLRQCADADLGILGEQRTGLGIHYRCRNSLYLQDAQLALDAGANEIALPFEPVSDDQRRRNDVTVTRQDGSSYRLVDADVEAGSKPRYDEDVTVNVASDGQLPNQTGWRYHQGTWPHMRYPVLTTDLTIAAERIDDYLALTAGDRVTVTNLPPQHPTDLVDLLVEGISEPISPTTWKPQLACSPAGIWEIGIRGDDTLGKRDTAGSELASQFVSGTNTSMSVATTLGPLWTTAAGDMPIEINVGGVRLTVTAISGASSPQTFTVTQTPVNGVTKTIPAGTPVRLWRATVRAL